MTPVVVLDASVGVKWFRREAGSDEARELVRAHLGGSTLLAVDTLFLYEVVSGATRGQRGCAMERIWSDLEAFGLAIVPPGVELMAAAAEQRQVLGCSPPSHPDWRLCFARRWCRPMRVRMGGTRE
jgi:predicted nucleic acid-binding protein